MDIKTLLTLFELIFIASVAFFMLTDAYTFTDEHSKGGHSLVNNLQQLINVAVSVNGNFKVKVPNEEKHEVILTNNLVLVKANGLSLERKIIVPTKYSVFSENKNGECLIKLNEAIKWSDC